LRIFLAGGAGAIGRPFISQAASRGHEIVATTTSKSRTALLASLGATPVVLDGLDASAVGEAVARARPDAIVHQMTALAGRPDMRHFDRWFAQTNRLRTEGTRHLLAAAEATGVKLFVAQSYAGWPSGHDPAVMTTETVPLDDHPAPSQRETQAAISFLERAVTTAPLTGIVLRYGSLYGLGATDGMVDMVRKRMVPIIGGGTGVTSWLHVDDAAGAALAAVEKPTAGLFNIVDDDPAPVAEWLPHMARVVGAKPPLSIPTWLGRLLAGDAGVRIMAEASGASNAKARRTFDWTPKWPSWREGFRHALVTRGGNVGRAA